MAIFEEFPDISLNFSDSIGTSITNESGKKIGKLNDYFVDYNDVYPVVLALQYKINRQLFYINWEDIISFSLNKIIIKDSFFVGRSRTYPKVQNKKVIASLLANQYAGETLEYPALGKIVLDRQVVDTHGKKVIRVNDIQFIKAGRMLRVTHAAVGIRSMVRRLGYEKTVDFFIKTIRPRANYLTKESLINWKHVHAIPNRSFQSNLKVSLSNEDFQDMHPADLADILEDLDNHGREVIFSSLDPKMAANILSEIDEEIRPLLLQNEEPENVADIIEQMDTDDAADILGDLSVSKAEAIIQEIDDKETQDEINELLEHKEDTAGGLMSTEVFEISPESTRSEVMEFIVEKHEEFENVYDIFVVDSNGSLVGTCSIKDLLIQKENLPIKNIMQDKDLKTLTPDVHWREVARYMSKYNLINLPIINLEQKLLGIISVDDVLPWLLDE